MSDYFKTQTRKAKDWRELLIENYLLNLRKGNLEKTLDLFTPGATVFSPLYGKVKAIKFYRNLFEDTSKSKITLEDIYLGNGKPPKAVAHFYYEWTLKGENRVGFWCIDIFQFNIRSMQISELTIIYDTIEARRIFEKRQSGS